MRKASLVLCASLSVSFLALEACSVSTIDSKAAAKAPPVITATSSKEDKIASALSAGPEAVTKEAAVVEFDETGKMTVLKQGQNAFTCMPDMPAMAGAPSPGPMCADVNAIDFLKAMMGHTAPPKDKAGFVYMLQGGNDASNTDPFAKAPAAGAEWIKTGPHVMVLGSPDLNKAYPHDAKPDTTKPYVMFPD
ncbi:MAG: hypothetical protein WCI21_09645, partial [Alphaproteobacteria bacterium]